MDELKQSPANSSPLTPLGFLERASTVYGNCISLIYHEKTYSWSDTYRRCLLLASSIASLGINRGDVVSVVAPNIPAMYELHFGVPMAGAILNTINTRLDARTVSIQLQHAESKLVFVDYQSTELVLQAMSLFPLDSSQPILVLIDEDNENPPRFGTEFEYCYEGLIKRGDPEFSWVRPASEWDPMVVNYTSGTTSAPKAVVHCHRGLFIITLDSLLDWSVPKQPVYLWTLPMFHSNGWSFAWGMAAVGATNVCLRKFDAGIIYASIHRHGVTHMCGAPVVLNMLSNYPERKKLEKPVHILTAGAPPPAAVLCRAEEMGFEVSHGYGLTEVAGLTVSCAWKRHWDKLPATEKARLKARQGVRTVTTTAVGVINSDTGESVKRDRSTFGEVVMRGGSVFLGYLKDPEATAKCLTPDGWFWTGDVGMIHPDGYLEIKDRSKDIIITGGENVSSVEIESILYSHPAVDEAAVVARPDEFWGETPCAFVTLRAEITNMPTEEEVIGYCRSKMPHYMVPKTVVFKTELPKTSTGKNKKNVLRDIATAMGSITNTKSRL